MENNTLLPTKIEVKQDENTNEGILTVEPCAFGYGTTIGNALRRVLLSSLQGAAVTAIKIKGAQHEFSTLKNVKEDVLEILLNFKMLRLKMFTDEKVRLKLHAKGEKKVTAKDIAPDSNVEIVNPDLQLATLTDKTADFEVEIVVEKGKGYLPTEERQKKEEDEIGLIAIDALFSPVKNVGFKVENVRVGQLTNFDKLTLVIETDGTVTPHEAVVKSAKILIDHFNLFLGLEDLPAGDHPKGGKPKKKEEKVEKKEEKTAEEAEPEDKEKKKTKKKK